MEPIEKLIGKKVLKLILKKLREGIQISDLEDPYFNDEVLQEIEDVIKVFGLTIRRREDYGFWAKLVLSNPSDSSEIIIPTIKEFLVEMSQNVRRYSTETFEFPVNSYDKNFVDSQILSDDNFYPNYDYMIDDNVYDSDSDRFEIDNITLINESISKKNKIPISENRDSRSKEIIELQKMKMLVEERLRILTS